MKINHEIIRCPDGTYAIWQGDTLVSEGWRTVEDARLHAAAARKNATKTRFPGRRSGSSRPVNLSVQTGEEPA